VKRWSVIGVSLLLGTCLSLPAQNTRIHTRKKNQQERIEKGVENGSLTNKEAARIEHHEHQINKEVRHERAENGGHLTKSEKKQVNRQQNRVSRQIYKQKHDAQNK
jgi:hypothetical protein